MATHEHWRDEYDEEVTFGKHQGKWFSEVPDRYKQWMLEQIAEGGPSKENAQFLRLMAFYVWLEESVRRNRR